MSSDAVRLAGLKVENETDLVFVPVSMHKPDIPEAIQKKWQRIVDLVAKIMDVPTGLITRLTTENLEIFVASSTKGNPYKPNDRDVLGIGMFCETVAGRRTEMLVQNSEESEFWRNNPHAGLGMRSYMGVPIQWSDGELFGTFCMLDDKVNRVTELYRSLVIEFREIIESDLEYIMLNEELRKKLTASELSLREVHHRIKNHFNLLIGYIGLRQRGSKKIDTDTLLADLQHRIRAISLLHDKLYRNTNTAEPLLNDYIGDLVRVILEDFLDRGVKLNLEIDPVPVPLDISLPIGLIVCELVSNSLKYAFAHTDNPSIRISLHANSDNTMIMEYSDNGPGYPEGFNPDEADSLGINLARMLTVQLHGTMRLTNEPGACYRAEITVKKHRSM